MNEVLAPNFGDLAISAIIPCHNDAPYVAAAIQSVLDQTLPVVELIVVDDGSTDDSAKIVGGIQDPRVKLISQQNRGISGARNAGLREATGNLIAFLDADDLWTSKSLEARAASLAGAPHAGVAIGLTEQFLSPDLSADLAARLHCPQGASAARFAGAMLVRRSVLDAVGGFDERLRIGEMMDWCSRLEAAGVSIVTTQEVVMRRRIHGANTVLQDPEADRRHYLLALKANLARKAQAS